MIPLAPRSGERWEYVQRAAHSPLTVLRWVPAHVPNVARMQGCSRQSHEIKAGPNLRVHQQVREESGQKRTMGYQATNLSAKQGKTRHTRC